MAKKSKSARAAQASSTQSNANPGGSKTTKTQPTAHLKAKVSSTAAKQPKKGAVPTQGSKATPSPAQRPQPPPAVSNQPEKADGKIACTVVPSQWELGVPDLVQREALRCARNVVFLERLTALPGMKAQEPPGAREPKDARHDPRRTLPFQEEDDLAKTLAFLSGISDDSNHVTAVSIEELPGEQGCKVLVAINRVAPVSGSEILNKIHAGFKKIFEQLAEIRLGMYVDVFSPADLNL